MYPVITAPTLVTTKPRKAKKTRHPDDIDMSIFIQATDPFQVSEFQVWTQVCKGG